MKKISLLLLEDEEMDVFLIKKVLERSGIAFNMTIAGNKEEFIKALSENTFDAILADHSLPQFSAIEALQLTKEKKINKPFILVTGTVSEDFAVRAMKDGAWDYILKDRLQRLPTAINGAMEKYLLETERKKYFDELVTKQALMNEGEQLAHFGSWQSDPINNSIYWSDGLYHILGYKPGEIELSIKSFVERIHPDEIETVKQILAEAYDRLDKQNYECRIVCADGSIKHIYAELIITRNERKEKIRLNGFMCDITARKEAEFKVVESEKKYKYLFENNPMPVWVFDIVTFVFLDVNKAAVRQYGYSREEFLSMTTLDIRPDEEKERYINLDRPRARGFNNNGIWKHIKKDGTIIHVEISTDDILFEGHNARLVLVNDVTEKIKAENKLKQSEARLKASQRIAHIGGWELDMLNLSNNADLKWSEETFRIFGLQPGEVEMSSEVFFSHVHPEDKIVVENAIKKAIDTNSDYEVEHRIIRKDGACRIVEERGEIIREEKTGKPLKIEGTVQDITERKTDRDLIQKSEANLRTIVNNTDTGYALLDTDLKVISFNEPVYKFVSEQLHKNLAEGTYAVTYFIEEKQAGISKCLQDALQGDSCSYEVCYPQSDGSEKWFYASYHPVWDNEKKILGVLMSIADITERKISELQEKRITDDLLQRNNDLEQFAYIISHNLRSPVANIIGVSNALLEGNLDEHDTREFMEGLSTSIHKLDSVIVDLNNILQVKHKINEHRERVCLSQVVNDIKFSVSNFSDTDMVMILTDFSEIDELSTLKSYIYSIFYNLISNSIKYRQKGVTPVIEIKSLKTHSKVVITFKDNSMGIDLEKKGDQVFGLYKRFHQQSAEGKGIGLFMVKTQVETLGGKIGIKSEINKGTEFRIEFELADLAN